MPHIFSEDKSIRFFATDEAEAKIVSNYLEDILKNRKEVSTRDSENNKFKPVPYFLIITDDYKKYKTSITKNLFIINNLVKYFTVTNNKYTIKENLMLQCN